MQFKGKTTQFEAEIDKHTHEKVLMLCTVNYCGCVLWLLSSLLLFIDISGYYWTDFFPSYLMRTFIF